MILTISFTMRVPCGGVGLHERPRQQHQHIWATERIHHQGERGVLKPAAAGTTPAEENRPEWSKATLPPPPAAALLSCHG